MIILSLSSSDMINKASEAKTKSDIANAKELASTAYAEWMLMSEAKKEEYNDNFSEYVVDKLGDAGLPTLAGAYTDLIGMKIGGYVAYTPATGGTTTTKERYESVFTTQTDLGWKYAGTDDNGNVILFSEIPQHRSWF